MPAFNPQFQLNELNKRLQNSPGLLVVCYCAQWCDTCGQYQTEFNALADKWPQYTFVWVDIEELPELLGDEDIENFPTLLIQDTVGNRFFSPLHPYISHLERLLQQADSLKQLPRQSGPPLLAPLLNTMGQ